MPPPIPRIGISGFPIPPPRIAVLLISWAAGLKHSANLGLNLGISALLLFALVKQMEEPIT